MSKTYLPELLCPFSCSPVARSPDQTLRQQDGIVTEEKLEVAGDNLLDLFFGLELNLGIECAGGSEEHEEIFFC